MINECHYTQHCTSYEVIHIMKLLQYSTVQTRGKFCIVPVQLLAHCLILTDLPTITQMNIISTAASYIYIIIIKALCVICTQ